MYNFRITFDYPWLLLLLIPAAFFTFFFYFRSSKKYRRNRNRITSLVLHAVIMVLCVSVLSGIKFRYDVPNSENQIFLLVDMSDSGSEAADRRDEIVSDIIDESRDQFNIGVVTFGYDQVLASPLSYDADEVYKRYIAAPAPDTTATDIASALNYTKSLFTGKHSKIVLISDGIQTDGDAISAVLSVASEGVRVDTVGIERPEADEVEIVNVTVPDYNVAVGDPFKMTVSLKSSVDGVAVLTLYDNNEARLNEPFLLNKGAQDITVEHIFENNGMHGLRFEVASETDTLTQNNSYYSYISIAVCDSILVLERNLGEASHLVSILKEDTNYNIDVINILQERDRVPMTVDGLRKYDEVILSNVSNTDMPEGFEDVLHSYVHNYGGGLFTVGGNDENGEANAYKRMENTPYQQMLPVQTIDYTPPLGVIFLADVSWSMDAPTSVNKKTRFDLSKEAIAACVQYSFSDRDYCGVMTLGEPPEEIASVRPVPRMASIVASLEKLEINMKGTPYAKSIDTARSTLAALTNVEKRHIVIMSDGDPTDKREDDDGYEAALQRCVDQGIGVSIVNLENSDIKTENLNLFTQMTKASGGDYIYIDDVRTLTGRMRELFEMEEIKGVNYKTYTPQIKTHTSVVSGITQAEIPTLDGFYGTKAKEEATTVLTGEFVPVYSQWKYGEGSVGSFMCDLNGTWSEMFISASAGRKIVRNIVAALFPTKDIRPAEINVHLQSDNYSTVMSIFTDLKKNERIEALYKTAADGGEVTTPIAMNPDNGYSRATFAITQPGIHEVTVRKVDDKDNVLAATSSFRVLSYSAEYDALTDFDGMTFMEEIAAKGKGISVEDPWEVYDGFDKVEHIARDPRLVLCIIALVLFLLDVAVRKFKFKWLHEIIRERRDKKYGAQR